MSARPWLEHYDPDVPESLTYPDGSLLDFLRRHASERPDATALIFKGRLTRWGALDRASDACAVGLASLGVRAGDKVALILPTCPQWVIAQLAVWKLGAVVAALNPIYTENELGMLLRATGARYAIALTRVYGRVKAVQPQTALELVVATNIKEYLPRHLAALFTLFKEKKEGHRISLTPGDRWIQKLHRTNDGATPPAVPRDRSG